MDRIDWIVVHSDDEQLGDNAMYVERLLPAARDKLVTISDDAPLTEAATHARDILQVLLEESQDEESMLRDYVTGVGYLS